MKARTWILVAAAVLVVGVAFTFASAAWAQAPAAGFGSGYAQARMAGGRGMGGMSGQMGGPEHSLVAIAAQQLGMQQADLIAQLQTGKTIAQVASDRNVSLDTIVNAFVADRQARMAQAVANGRMTQAEADAMLVTMRANVTARLNQSWPQGAGRANADGDGVCDHAGGGQMRGQMRGRMNQ